MLVVEDEPVLRLDLGQMLVDRGARVLDAGDAAGAIRLLGENPEIDVVLTDIQMPGGMDGLALARWIQRRYPAKKVILMSGDRRLAKPARDLFAGAAFLPKPFDHKDLLTLLQESVAKR